MCVAMKKAWKIDGRLGQNPNKCINVFVTVLHIFELCSLMVGRSPENSSVLGLGDPPMSKSDEFLGEHLLVDEMFA